MFFHFITTSCYFSLLCTFPVCLLISLFCFFLFSKLPLPEQTLKSFQEFFQEKKINREKHCSFFLKPTVYNKILLSIWLIFQYFTCNQVKTGDCATVEQKLIQCRNPFSSHIKFPNQFFLYFIKQVHNLKLFLPSLLLKETPLWSFSLNVLFNQQED